MSDTNKNSDSDQILNYKYPNGVLEIHPAHELVTSWAFTESERDEAILAQAIAVVANKNGLSANDISHIFPSILRILKSEIPWSK